MPYINRIRVNNVKYNFGTQFYDDFVMRFSGKNAIYDLANGGGKSVLMLLLLQNLLPNCTLDEKQPVEKLFRAGNDNTVIHSLIEWKLNPCDVKNGFQYMTTGFCARKARDHGVEENSETASVEYFNYCIFYREFQRNDIVNLPLSDGQERITFGGLRTYLRELDKKDFSVRVYLFDKKGDYQRFISNYGLYESEWEIIRGINKTEGHVRTYFESHYKTTRKVVEDLFIEEIIEKSFRNKMDGDSGETEIARTLLDIKDKLVELSKKKGELSHYDSQLEVLEGFQTRLSGLKGIYGKKAALEEKLVVTYHTATEQMKQSSVLLDETRQQTEELDAHRHALKKSLENAAIVEEERVKRGLLATLEEVKREYDELEAVCKIMEAALKERESANHYLDYLENKKLAEVQYNVISSMSADKEELLEELHTLAFNRKQRKEELLCEMKERREVILCQLEQNREQLQKLDQLEHEAQSLTAVLESREETLSKQAEGLEDRLEKLRERSRILLLEEASEKLLGVRKEEEKLRCEKEELNRQAEEATAQYQRLEWESGEAKERLQRAKEELELVKQAVGKQKKQLEWLVRMEELYEKKGIEALLICVTEAYREICAKLVQTEEQITAFKERLGCEDGNAPLVVNETLKKVLAYVRRHYDEEAKLGVEYLMSCTKQQRRRLLEQVPYLSGAILVDDHLLEISVDARLQQMDLNGQLIPLLSRELLKKEPEKLSVQDVTFLVEEPGVLYDKQKLEEAIKRLRSSLEEEEHRRVRIQEQARVLEEDLGFLLAYKEQESTAKTEQERYQRVMDEIRMLQEREAELQEKKQQLYERAERFKLLCKEQDERLEELADRENVLDEICHLYEKFVQIEVELGQCRSEKEPAQRQLENAQKSMSELRRACAQQEQALRNLEDVQRQEEENWRSYAPYEEQGIYPILEIDSEELESLFAGKRLAFEQGNADVADKKQLIATYERAMEKSLEAVNYGGISVELLERLYKEHQLSRTPMETLMRDKSELEKKEQELVNASRELADCQTRLDREEGALHHARASYEEKFGTYEPVEMEPEKLRLFMKETKEQLSELKNAGKTLEKRTKELEKQYYKCTSMKEEMERMLESFAIRSDAYQGMLPKEASLQETYRQVRREYERMVKEEQQRREDFEKDKAKRIDMLKHLNAYDLAKEIERSIFNPKTMEDVEEHLDNISHTKECILLEKERIGRGLEDMEVIKDNFENRCLQTCMTIKEALERLPKLSIIRLDEKQVHMVMLNVPYVKEELYKERMSRYIDETVQQADFYTTAPERLKYIRGRLAWKRLFSVIVKDMDKMKLQLYKRERMKEQSRYLKYEEAVGSTGQSQGIYIQFLVAVINYIASMNAANADVSVLHKVIFLDNPFGAAKDVYIWEPIFRLLEANHVQLIVPARGATPAITGRFAVNYILGQKLIGGRLQTVVVDYRSEVNSMELEYTELMFEQTQLKLE